MADNPETVPIVRGPAVRPHGLARGPVVEVLVGLADGGQALELGIETGRIALPVARHAVAVHGISVWKGGPFA